MWVNVRLVIFPQARSKSTCVKIALGYKLPIEQTSLLKIADSGRYVSFISFDFIAPLLTRKSQKAAVSFDPVSLFVCCAFALPL
jgi:hypothetical protein